MTQLPSGTAGNVAGGERLALSCLNTSSGVLARSLVGGIGPQADTTVPSNTTLPSAMPKRTRYVVDGIAHAHVARCRATGAMAYVGVSAA